MICKYVTFILIFALGEFIVNKLWFTRLKRRFVRDELNPVSEEEGRGQVDEVSKLCGIDISIFKGVMERFIIAFCLAISLPQILVVFGALKIGTRLKDSDDKVKSDYFLIGNLSSIIISVFYVFLWQKVQHL